MSLTAHVLALAVVFTTAPKPAEAHHGHGCKTKRCHKRVETKRADRECSQRNPRACVRYVVLKKRITGWRRTWLLRIPACESGWNPYAYFGHPQNRGASTALTRLVYDQDISSGVYAFKPSTWQTTPYANHSIWSARWQAYAAAWMAKVGRAPGEWACKV